MSPSVSYFARPQTDTDATLLLTVDADGQTLMRHSKVVFSLQRFQREHAPSTVVDCDRRCAKAGPV